ncbi:MAG: hypothetical protein COW01_03620 [Bdellovibrionales bacterium CG12_big_fil_rev_8_21_14_0_65_38_15]|nr:MAG: hypothetical protein COW79_15625 [Bdellovibrionales bacterium CG22_combo_CG10-13_8_21_14_all_38_13]PIQ56791.1 MAG: hypothetical protein COW01_03620 [Bdellovibrionales bacterium CG12_big_fil_rev_8_21_14_0_65_38_15]
MIKKISIITITYNNFEELVKTLKSIPEHQSIESVVINGGTCKDSVSFLDCYNGRSVSEPDKGISDAFNKGVQLSSGDYLMFLNSGDIISKPKIFLSLINIICSSREKILLHASPIFFEYEKPINQKVVLPVKVTGWKNAIGMPCPHPGLIASKSLFNCSNSFSNEFKLSMDFHWFMEVYKHNPEIIKYTEIHKLPYVTMDGKGVSSKFKIRGLKENGKALYETNSLSIVRIFKLLVAFILLLLSKSQAGNSVKNFTKELLGKFKK